MYTALFPLLTSFFKATGHFFFFFFFVARCSFSFSSLLSLFHKVYPSSLVGSNSLLEWMFAKERDIAKLVATNFSFIFAFLISACNHTSNLRYYNFDNFFLVIWRRIITFFPCVFVSLFSPHFTRKKIKVLSTLKKRKKKKKPLFFSIFPKVSHN